MAYENVLYEKKDRIARVTLNRPEKLNALSHDLLEEYADALMEAEGDGEVRVVIVKGAGRAFSAGYDVGGAPRRRGYTSASSTPSITPFLDDRASLNYIWGKTATPWSMAKPVIAQVHGYCVAGGNDVAGQCDIVIAAEDAVIQQPQIRRLGLTFTHMFPYKCGAQWAKILMFTGDPISGKEAERLGIVAIAVPGEELEDQVNRLAERIALVDPTLLAMNKLAINRVFEEMGLRNAFDAANALDTISHTAKAMQDFLKTSREQGLRTALSENEGPFRESPRPFEVP